MTARLAVSLVIALLSGFLLAGWLWPTVRRSPRGSLLLCSLAAGAGLGLSSCLFFVWLLVAGSADFFPVAEPVLVLLAAGILLILGRAGRTAPPAPAPAPGGGRIHPLLALAGWCSAAATAAAFAVESAMHPHGAWDAWMTWNMHARALFRGGDVWRDVLRGLPPWSHPDYPLLVPASVARLWTYAGNESALGPVAVAFVFTFATAGVLFAALSILRSPTQGLLAALLLLGTKFFILHGTTQYADIPLGFFLLATLVLLALPAVWPDARSRLLLLAGAMAGLAAWTKNEGLLFLLAVPAGYGFVGLRAGGWQVAARDARAFAVGLAPVLVLLVGFKLWMAAPNDLLSDQGIAQTAARLLEGDRYRQIVAGFTHALLEVSARGVIPLLLVIHLVSAGLAPPDSGRAGARPAVLVVALMLAGYAAVLLVAPAPRLGTNIRSINRLLLQLWPSMLLAYFLLVRTADEMRGPGRRLTHP